MSKVVMRYDGHSKTRQCCGTLLFSFVRTNQVSSNSQPALPHSAHVLEFVTENNFSGKFSFFN